MEITLESQTDTPPPPQQEAAPHTTGRTRDVASVAEASEQRTRPIKKILEVKIYF